MAKRLVDGVGLLFSTFGTLSKIRHTHYFIGNIDEGLVQKLPCFWTSNCDIVVPIVPRQFLNFHYHSLREITTCILFH